MRLFILVLALILSACAVTDDKQPVPPEIPGIAKQEYVPGTEDIPVFFGFKAVENSLLSYDSVDGRIIDVEFSSDKTSAKNVRNFYEVTLPQLGWHKRQYQIYEREGEVLKLNILEKNNLTFLKFTIRPSA